MHPRRMGPATYLLWGGLGEELDGPVAGQLLSASLAAAGLERPRVLVLATASGDDPAQLARAHQAFGQLGCVSEHLPLFQFRPVDWRQRIARADLLWVCGGSTLNLLALWRAHGLDVAIEQRHAQRPLVLAGTSAGMNCWFEGSVSWAGGHFEPLPDGLGWVRGSACPHADSQPDRLAVYERAVATGALPDGHAIGETTVVVLTTDERGVGRVEQVIADGVPMHERH